MEELLKKLSELIRLCEVRLKKIDLERSELSSLRNTLNKQKEKQDGIQKELAVREKELGKKYKVICTLDEANEIKKESKQMIASLKADREAFEKLKQSHAKQITVDKAGIQAGKDKIAQQVKELEIKKKSYKQEVMRNITDNMAK